MLLFFSSEPKRKKTKPSPTKTQATASSTLQEDPRAFTDLSEQQQNPLSEYRRHWHQIRTRFSRKNRLLDWYNYRLFSLHSIELLQHLNEIFTDQTTVFKLNVSFGFILRNNETGSLQYYYASRNNNHLFDTPFQIATAADLQQVRQTLHDTDILEYVRQQRPNSKWVVEQVTNATFFVTKLRDHAIGRGKILPNYIVENRGIVTLDKNLQTGKPYKDNLCLFRALVLHNGCHTKNLERGTQHYFEKYRQTLIEKKKITGVKLEELSNLERLFEVNKHLRVLVRANESGWR